MKDEGKKLTKNIVPPNIGASRKRKTLQTQTAAPSCEGAASLAHSQPPEEHWELPKRSYKKRPSAEPQREDPLPTSGNQFQPLDGEDNMDEESADENIEPPLNQSRKAQRPPPFFTTNTVFKEIIALITALDIPKKEFSIKEAISDDNVVHHTIYISEHEQYALIKKTLIDNKIQFYSYTPREEKPKTFIIKGIRGGFTSEEIKTELEDAKIPNVTESEKSRERVSRDEKNRFGYGSRSLSTYFFPLNTMVTLEIDYSPRFAWAPNHTRKNTTFLPCGIMYC